MIRTSTIFVLILPLQFMLLNRTYAQDTFSIVAVDTITGEVGSAGASCVDLFEANLGPDDFISQLIPGKGAINTQAYYQADNQRNASAKLLEGYTPAEIVDWLRKNDSQDVPDLRQYGIAALVDGIALTAALTGNSTDPYKGHIIGKNYAIQGNILLGKEVLDSMEAGFLREPGDLACKLMAALQGAKMVGADKRCALNGTSSLFAFLKVAQPTDSLGDPSLRVSIRTHYGDRTEPIDSLQTLFDRKHPCEH